MNKFICSECGMCASVVLHEIPTEEITCPDCEFTSDICDFPDLNYQTMETSKQYQVFYGKNYVCTITAFSPYQAIDKVFYLYVMNNPNIERKKLKTKKCKV